MDTVAEKQGSRLDVMSEEQQYALFDFRAEHGRQWKSALRELWASGRDSGALRQIRNEHAPLIDRLRDSDFAGLEAREAEAVSAKEARKDRDMAVMAADRLLLTDVEPLMSAPGMGIQLDSRSGEVLVVHEDGSPVRFAGVAAVEAYARQAELSSADQRRMVSLAKLGQTMVAKGIDLSDVSLAVSGRLVGPVVAIKDDKVIQDIGQGKLVGHEAAALREKTGREVKPGDSLDVRYVDRLMKAAELASQDGQSVSVSLHTR